MLQRIQSSTLIHAVTSIFMPTIVARTEQIEDSFCSIAAAELFRMMMMHDDTQGNSNLRLRARRRLRRLFSRHIIAVSTVGPL